METELFKLFIENLEGSTNNAFRFADTDEAQARAEALETVMEVARGTLYQYNKKLAAQVELEKQQCEDACGYEF